MNTKEVSYVGEIWKDIKDYEDEYEVSNLGRVRNKKTKRILKLQKSKIGYMSIKLCKNGKITRYSVHRLVYEAFIGEIPKGMEVNHIDENKQNNILPNLNLLSHRDNNNWGTRNERMSKAQRNNKTKSKSVIQKSLDGKVIKIWPSAKEIQRALGYSCGHICNCCRGGRFSNSRGKWINITQAYGFIWEYTEKATA